MREMSSRTLVWGTRGLLKFPVYCERMTRTRDGKGIGEEAIFILYINLVSPRHYVLVAQLPSACVRVFVWKTVA